MFRILTLKQQKFSQSDPVFHYFHIFTSNWYSQLFQISVFADRLRAFATPHVS